MTENMDPRPLHRRAVAQTGTAVAAVSPSQLGLPTPCTEYDVRALLSHIIGGLTRAALVGEGDPDALARLPSCMAGAFTRLRQRAGPVDATTSGALARAATRGTS